MVTGIDDRANVASFLRAGVDDYVLKPLVLQELQVRLTVCLERRRLQNWVDTLEQTDVEAQLIPLDGGAVDADKREGDARLPVLWRLKDEVVERLADPE